MRVRLASTSCETSLMILALSLGERVVNHLARRCIEGKVSQSHRAIGWWGTSSLPLFPAVTTR